ncbi:MAG TPA: oxidoreductase, partial [Casimicrobiaceae bacterium]|nr:oxidoreductase [Casimicrobiaceae bacterium]
MPLLTKDRTLIDDRWALLPETAAIADVPAATPAIVALALWSAQHDLLAGRDDIGVWLKPADDPEALAGDVARLP